jgi:hypothetical protein
LSTGGRLHIEFKDINFLNYTVETYECQVTKKKTDLKEDDKNLIRTRNDCGHYIILHPKLNTHIHIHQFKNHAYLPNIIGPWLPRRDGDNDSKPYYFAAMLVFLKPWRNFKDLKDCHES